MVESRKDTSGVTAMTMECTLAEKKNEIMV